MYFRGIAANSKFLVKIEGYLFSEGYLFTGFYGSITSTRKSCTDGHGQRESASLRSPCSWPPGKWHGSWPWHTKWPEEPWPATCQDTSQCLLRPACKIPGKKEAGRHSQSDQSVAVAPCDHSGEKLLYIDCGDWPAGEMQMISVKIAPTRSKKLWRPFQGKEDKRSEINGQRSMALRREKDVDAPHCCPTALIPHLSSQGRRKAKVAEAIEQGAVNKPPAAHFNCKVKHSKTLTFTCA